MERTDSSSRGKVLLATVKGDVHDIGKNLVDIILSNNGFEVVNLGIKVPSEQLIQGVREHQPDVIGLSGLLVKSAQQMVLTAGDFAAVGVETPLLVGGAALNRRFTHRKIAAAYGGGFCTYAADAMTGLALVERLTDTSERPALEDEIAALIASDREGEDVGRKKPRAAASGPAVRRDVPSPAPPDLDHHVEELDPREVWGYVNPQMLYGKHLGLKGSHAALKARSDPKLAKLETLVAEVQGGGPRGRNPAGQGSLALLPGALGRPAARALERQRSGGRMAATASGQRGRSLPHRLRPRQRPRGALRDHGRQRHPAACRGAQGCGRVPEEPHPRRPRPRDGRGRGRAPPRPPARGPGASRILRT